jgi:hypothetical protein
MVDILRAIGLEGAATALWQHPAYRKIAVGAAGTAIGSIAALTDLAATIICDELKGAVNKKRVACTGVPALGSSQIRGCVGYSYNYYGGCVRRTIITHQPVRGCYGSVIR